MFSLEEDSDVLLAAARRFDQRGGNPIFRAIFTAVGRNRSFCSIVEQRRFRLTFQQLRTAGDNEPLGEAITEAIRQGLQRVVTQDQINPFVTGGHSFQFIYSCLESICPSCTFKRVA